MLRILSSDGRTVVMSAPRPAIRPSRLLALRCVACKDSRCVRKRFSRRSEHRRATHGGDEHKQGILHFGEYFSSSDGIGDRTKAASNSAFAVHPVFFVCRTLGMRSLWSVSTPFRINSIIIRNRLSARMSHVLANLSGANGTGMLAGCNSSPWLRLSFDSVSAFESMTCCILDIQPLLPPIAASKSPDQ